MVVEPGAVFVGQVVGDADRADAATLVLGGTSAASLSGFGTQFTGFSYLVESAGAHWTLTDSNNISCYGFKVYGALLSDATIDGASGSEAEPAGPVSTWLQEARS